MTAKKKRPPVRASLRPIEIALGVVPFLALIPNFFIIPDLNYPGLVTQEYALAWAAAALSVLALIEIRRSGGEFVISRERLWICAALALWILWQAISLLWAPEISEGIRLIGIWLIFAVIFACGALFLHRRGATLVFAALTAIVFILAISQFIEYAQYGGQMYGVFFSHGITSELLALLLPLLLVTYLTAKDKTITLFSLLAAAAGGAALLLTLRRGALLGAAVAFLFIALALARGWIEARSRSRLLMIGAAIVILGGGIFAFKGDELITRLKEAVQVRAATEGRATELGLTSRLTKWLVAWEMGKTHPLFGVGAGGFTSRYGDERRHFEANPRYAGISAIAEAEDFDEIRSPNSHSEFLQIFAELGLIGVILFLAFWVLTVRHLWRARGGENGSPNGAWIIGVLGGLLAFWISSAISGFSLRFTPGAVIAASLLGLGLAHARETEVTAKGKEPRAIPGWAAVAVCAILFLLSGALALRTGRVKASQQAQSQIDFRFSPDTESVNEALLRRYEQALSLDPANSGAHLGLGLLLYQIKRPAEARPHVEYALAHSYSRPFTYILLAFVYEQTGDLGRANAVLARCLESFPRSTVARAAYAALLRKEGRTDLADAQQQILERADARVGRSWSLALRMKDAPAAAEAQRQGLIPPGELEPMLARALVQARSFHYLK